MSSHNKSFLIAGLAGLALLILLKLLPSDLVASAAGLPAHPLVVHGAVVLLPLAAVAVVVLLWLRRRSSVAVWITLAGVWIGSAAAVIAEQSGTALAIQVGMPSEHAEWGDRLSNASIVWFVVATFALWWTGRQSPVAWRRVVSAGATLFATGIIVLVVLAGHSGAAAVWGEAQSEATSTTTESALPTPTAAETSLPTPSASDSATATATATAAADGYTLADVAAHGSASSCWTAIKGSVYDLSSFVAAHPGGASNILRLCGRDGTASFTAQHGGQGQPERELASLKIGALLG